MVLRTSAARRASPAACGRDRTPARRPCPASPALWVESGSHAVVWSGTPTMGATMATRCGAHQNPPGAGRTASQTRRFACRGRPSLNWGPSSGQPAARLILPSITTKPGLAVVGYFCPIFGHSNRFRFCRLLLIRFPAAFVTLERDRPPNRPDQSGFLGCVNGRVCRIRAGGVLAREGSATPFSFRVIPHHDRACPSWQSVWLVLPPEQ